MTISIIAVIDKNNAIGKDNKLLCYLPADLKHFKNLTSGHTIVMGRKTFESLPNGALPNRRNIILTRDKTYKREKCEIANSVDEVLSLCEENEEIFIIGGEQVYKLFIDKADKLFLTRVDHEFEADTFFPHFDIKNWSITKKEDFKPDEKNKFFYSFVNCKKNTE